MAPTKKEKTEWSKLKRVIVRRNAVKNLKSLDAKSLKSIRNEHGKNLLHAAAKRGRIETCEYLIKIGCEINLKDTKNANTPLICVLKRDEILEFYERLQMFEFLINSGADLSWNNISKGNQIISNDSIRFTLCSALKNREGGVQEAVNYLLSNGWTFDNIACLQNDEFTNCALKSDHRLDGSYTKLLDAIVQQDLLEVKQLVELVSHSKRILSWVLLQASKYRSPASSIIIKLLLDYGAPIDGFIGDEITPLEEAFQYRNFDNCWVLLDHGAFLNTHRIKLTRLLYPLNFSLTLDEGPEEEFSEDAAEAHNCILLWIEHQGVCNCQPVYRSLPTRHDMSYCQKKNSMTEYLTLKYLMIQKHSLQYDGLIKDFSFLFSLPPSQLKYYKKCINEELLALKRCKVDNNIFLWDFLIKTIDEMIPFARNESLVNHIKSDSFNEIFPYYSKILQFKVDLAVEKRLMIDKSIDVLSTCLPRVGSYHPVLERIIYHLGVPNLLYLEWNNY